MEYSPEKGGILHTWMTSTREERYENYKTMDRCIRDFTKRVIQRSLTVRLDHEMCARHCDDPDWNLMTNILQEDLEMIINIEEGDRINDIRQCNSSKDL